VRTVRGVQELRDALAPTRRSGLTIGLVPTMGALHQGHLSLIELAREQCDVVVMSLFVNPAQFNERADLDAYPRDERRDAGMAGESGADMLFTPTVEEVYPSGFATSVEVSGLTDKLEGAVRGAAHFRGVTTVVSKLLNMTMPDIAYFGQKDAQQVVVIRRMVTDLNLPVRIEVGPTVREHDGLAMSSRNVLLNPRERARAAALPAALNAACDRVGAGECSADELLEAARAAMARFDVTAEYLELVEPDTLEPVDTLERPALLTVAARIGSTRLIDNTILSPVLSTNQRPTLTSTRKASTRCSV
jgi:pantoate--beta-alanine ligase